MTSDDVSVIWKSAFSFTMSTKGGGGGGGYTTGTEQEKGDVETREEKKYSPSPSMWNTQLVPQTWTQQVHKTHWYPQSKHPSNTCTFRFTHSWMPIIIPSHNSQSLPRTRVHKAAINTTYQGDSGVITVVLRPGTGATKDHTVLPSRFYKQEWLIIMWH